MNIFSILVTYNPNFSQLKKCVSSLLPQVEKIIIVKNSSEKLDFSGLPGFLEKIIQIQLKKNFGIAYAQNRGIEKALELGAEWILLSDQDTVFPENYVSSCLSSYNQNKEKYKIGAIVPLFFNENKQQMSQIMISKTKAICPEYGKTYCLAHAIASGMFCLSDVIKNIGMMNERLFIDFVDTEWCWRANRLGFKILCDTNIVISHSMGDSFKKVFGRKFVVYSNFRNYFFFRNIFYLLFHSGLLSLGEFFRLLHFANLKTVIFFLTKGESLKNIRLFFKAAFKGIFNRFSLEEEFKDEK